MQRSIYNWFAEFKRCRVNLCDEFRGGRPSTAVNNKSIDALRRMIETYRHVSYHEIGASLDIGMISMKYNIWRIEKENQERRPRRRRTFFSVFFLQSTFKI
ncbi:hypothetical protein EVAR_91705_1 [Eumeta japonica]|uniref:Histone-lysine N-methyltransferase SETMAR n=1 Tax=Eumeta variegata TaxID=151549 RepID=A0A4C1T0H4_EUMVA|nr:hypothetical protein EVAR_91705_1 [Eumeta japonica]